MSATRLNVLTTQVPWYAEGLNFTCSQCGNCCTGGPGYVWVSSEEIKRLATFLKLSTRDVIAQYCRKIGDRYSLKENRNVAGDYDCVFLKEIPVHKEDDDRVIYTRRVCTVYDVRPLQCRTWPFWDGNLASKKAWDNSAKRCHGMNHGREFTHEQIEALRTATDWPQRPPTSGDK
jgi:uncharacterized protein